MKKVLVVLFLGFLFLIAGEQSSFADMCGCTERMAGGMHEGMPMMGGMQHECMGMMGGMKHECMGMSEGMMGEGCPLCRHLAALGLDEKQKDAVKEIKSRLMKETIKKKAEKQILGIELKDLLAKDPVDMKAVEAKLKQKESLKTDMHLSHIKAMEEIKAKLTPEQRKKLKEMMERGGMKPGCSMMEGMMHHGEMGGPPQPAEKKEQPAAEHKHH